MSGTGIAEIGTWRTRLVVWLLHRFFFLSRGMTMGVRAACFDAEGRVFMVRHTYVPGWYLPGGGMERGETALQALAKELREEGNLVMTEAPELFHVYFNRRASKRDHVLFYRVSVKQTAPRPPDREIAENGFFAFDALPDKVTDATLRRLAELRGEVERSDYW
ncbi:NUDIX domain-containing protein [Neorhizobium sp. NCHU2750]|uniref:NUDIX domain-containing protein n=1 Tax=Neorhizobium sp. NCHU2750 TaxID=1825976 RepID=UPI000E764F21|nr:DNA mismatch repair protein MutT [Neorhizobium sp. NCHU2750]